MIKYLPLTLLPLTLFAENGEPPPPQSHPWESIVMIGIGIAFLYFILIRPEQKRRKALEAQIESLKTGDKVTAVGIVGTIDKIKEETCILKMVDGNKIEVIKGAITQILDDKQA